MNEWLKGINKSVVGAVLVFAAAAAWGLSGIFVTLILENSSGTAVSLAFWRDLTAFAVLFLYTRLTRPRNLKIDRKDLPWLVGMGIFLGAFHIVYNQSVVLNGVAITTVLQTAMPAVVTIASFYIWKEALTIQKFLAMGVIFTGTAIASGLDIFSLDHTTALSLLSGAAVPLLYAGWSLCGKAGVSKYGAGLCLTIAFGVASIMLLPLQPFTRQPLPVNPAMAAAFLGLISISTFGGFILYFMGMKHIQAGIASILVMSEIFFAGLYSRVFLGERQTLVQVLGILLVIMGVISLSYRLKKKNPILLPVDGKAASGKS